MHHKSSEYTGNQKDTMNIDQNARPNAVQFCAITGADMDMARHCLRESNDNLSEAINFFLDHQPAQAAVVEPNDPDELLSYWRSPSRWQTEEALLPEYRQAMNSIIIKPKFMRDSTMNRALRKLEATAKEWPPRDMNNTFHNVLGQLLRKAWPRRNSFVHTFTCRFENQRVSLFGVAQECSIGDLWNSCEVLFSFLGWERPYLLQALQLLIGVEDSSGLRIIAGLMKRGADECNARKRAVFYNIINRIPVKFDHIDQRSLLNVDNEGAIACHFLRNILVEYIDSIKEKAFQSTFLEPTKMYFHKVRDYTMEGDVDVHGANIYLALLASTLGIALNRDPFMREDTVKGVVQFTDINIDHAQHGCWLHEHLGKSWESIPFYRNIGRIPRKQANKFYFNGGWTLPAVQMGRNAVNPGLPTNARKHFAIYLEQFCSYFSKSFILQRMFTHLTVEQNGEIERKLQIAYESFRDLESQHGGERLPEDVKFYCWEFSDDLISCTFNCENALRLFSYIGVC